MPAIFFMKKTLLIASILSLMSCRPSLYAPYSFTTAEAYPQHVAGGSTERYIIVEEDYSPVLVHWLSRVDESGNIADLGRKANKNFEDHITELNEQERIYFSGVVYLLRKKYLRASRCFQKCFEDFNMPQAGLLYAESHRIYIEKSLSEQEFEAYPIYQQSYDFSHDNPTLQALINQRFKYYQSGF